MKSDSVLRKNKQKEEKKDKKDKNSEKEIVIVYHKSSDTEFCEDGFAAAFAAWLRFRSKAEYWPGLHGKQIPIEAFRGKIAYFLDFSYPIAVMEKIEAVSKSLTVIDHHKSVIEEAKGLPYFAESKTGLSGAALAWHYFQDPKKKYSLPLMFQHIQDNDLWKHQLEETKPFIYRLRLEKHTFKHWEELLYQLEDKGQHSYCKFIKQGKLLQKQIEYDTDAMMDQAFPVKLSGIVGLAINANRSYVSELGEKLANQSGTFAAIFKILPDAWVDISLRSQSDECDVGKIATSFGGGGHPRSAGFRVKVPDIIKKMLPETLA